MEQLFSQSFNNFSDMQHRLQKRVDVALGHDAPSWSMRYSCPACGFEVCSPLCSMLQCTHCFFFQQPNEESLVPAWMHAIDGCDSQKHDKIAGSCDKCTFDSKVFLPCSFVDGFKNEVKSHAAAQRAGKDLLNVVESKDSFVDPKGEQDNCCGSNWKAATSKELPPASKEAFEQTGVFACLCRHGIVEFLIEFMQSAEM